MGSIAKFAKGALFYRRGFYDTSKTRIGDRQLRFTGQMVAFVANRVELAISPALAHHLNSFLAFCRRVHS